MSSQERRLLQIALPGAWVRIDGASRTLARHLQDLTLATPSLPDPIELGLQLRPLQSRIEIWSNGHFICSADPPDLVDALIRTLNRLVLDSDHQRLHLHASCVELSGCGILVAGPSGSGKSTIALGLIKSGALYLTDEIATVVPGIPTVFGYPKPLTLKSDVGLDLFKPRPPVEQSSSERSTITASLLGSVGSRTHVDHVIFPSHQSMGARRLTRISHAEASRRLLADSMDSARLGAGSLDAIAHVVRSASCWELTYPDLESAVEMIGALTKPRVQRTAVAIHELETQANQFEVPSGIRVAQFTDSAVAISYPEGRLIELHRDELDELACRAHGERKKRILDRLERQGISPPRFPHVFRSVPLSEPCVSIGLAAASSAQVLAANGIGVVVNKTPASTGHVGAQDADRLIVRSENLKEARDLTYNSSVEVVDHFLPAAYRLTTPPEEVIRWSVPVRTEAGWVPALHPLHRFYSACADLALARNAPPDLIDQVAICSPATEVSAITARTIARDRGLDAVVARALTRGPGGAVKPPTALTRFQKPAPFLERIAVDIYRWLGPGLYTPIVSRLIHPTRLARRRSSP